MDTKKTKNKNRGGQNSSQKTKDSAKRTPLKRRVEFRWSRRV